MSIAIHTPLTLKKEVVENNIHTRTQLKEFNQSLYKAASNRFPEALDDLFGKSRQTRRKKTAFSTKHKDIILSSLELEIKDIEQHIEAIANTPDQHIQKSSYRPSAKEMMIMSFETKLKEIQEVYDLVEATL